jgi:DNA-binding NtrC family response regulator
MFRKFSADFAEKYRMPAVQLNEASQRVLVDYRWPGNVRQLKNITEQISIIEENRHVNAETLRRYLPESHRTDLPVLYRKEGESQSISERDLLYKVLFDMKKDINELKKVVADMLKGGEPSKNITNAATIIDQLDQEVNEFSDGGGAIQFHQEYQEDFEDPIQESEVIEESLSLQQKEIDMIKKALEKHNGKRKNAANDLGISERTLYRKIKEYNIKN